MSWSKAQYTVYKEEQASWRQDQSNVRYDALCDMLDDLLHPSVARWRQRTLFWDGIWVRTVIVDSDDRDDGGNSDEDGTTGQTICPAAISPPPAIGHESSISTETLSANNTNDDSVRDALPDDIWETPSSETDENGELDEFQWLWQRGGRPIHDHWRSRHREDSVDKLHTFIRKEVNLAVPVRHCTNTRRMP